ncbi:MAG: cytochrome b5-like heme/steroid binding domain-containing protein [Candidatus Micrarchaeia archaeon]
MRTFVPAIAFMLLMLVSGCIGQPAQQETAGQTAGGGLPVPTAAVKIGPEEVARHSTAQDCWVVVEGKVYDVTSIMGKHPNVAKCIIPFCGKDATSSFRSYEHSNDALKGIYVGEFGG